MADSELNIKITAENKASAAINSTTKSLDQLEKEMDDLIRKNEQVLGGMGSLEGAAKSVTTGGFNPMIAGSQAAATALGQFGGTVGQVTSQIGFLIGTGGMAGLAVAAVELVTHIDEITDEIAEWISGIDELSLAYNKLGGAIDSVIEKHKANERQIALVGLAGSKRVGEERRLLEQELKGLEGKIKAGQADKARIEADVTRAREIAALAPGLGAIGLAGPTKEQLEMLKTATERLKGLEVQAVKTRDRMALLGAEFPVEQAKEGAKAAKELAEIQKKAAAEERKLDEEAYELNRKAVEQDFKDWEKKEQAMQRYYKAWGEEFRKREKEEQEMAAAMRRSFDASLKPAQEGLERFIEGQQKIQRTTIKNLDEQFEKERKEEKRAYEKMIDNVRDGAGRVFDAMLTKGESVFSSLAKFAEGVLQTMLRNIFQNAIVAIAQSSGIMQRLFGGGGFGGGGGGGPFRELGPGGGVGAIPGAGLAAMGGFGGLANLFKRGGGATGGMGPFLGETAVSQTRTGFATTAAGGALMAGGALAGQMLAMDAFRRGSAIEGLAGGAMAGASIGTMIAPGVGTAIGAGVGAIAGLITGLFGGGAQRRAEEAAKRAAMLEANQFAAPETITRYGTWGGPGEFAVEPDLTGQIRGIGRQPTVVNNIEVQLIDARHAREAGEVIANTVSERLLSGGSLLADNVAWSAS